MNNLRRDLIKFLSTGSASILLRSVVTGIPASALLTMTAPKTFAQSANGDALKPQFLLFSMRSQGDPFNINCPGSYDSGISTVFNNPDPKLKPVNISLNGKSYRASKPWGTLPQWALDRTAFIHHRTYQGIHSQFGNVMELVGSTRGPNGEANFPDHLSSVISNALGAEDKLDTIQKRPLRFGGGGVKFQSQSVQSLSPTSLKSLFDSPQGIDKQLQDLRDKEVDKFAAMLKGSRNSNISRSQNIWLEQQLRSKEELRKLNSQIIAQLSNIKGGGLNDQINAALLCFKLRLSPVAAIGIPFGGDNHNDEDWLKEVGETISGCGHMKHAFDQIKKEGLQDQVTLANLNVFGRSFKKKGTGRSHNAEHHVMAVTGPNINAGVYGGLMKIGNDAGATGIQSNTGESTNNGDIPATQTLESAAKTLGYALGISNSELNKRIKTRSANGDDVNVGKVISAAIRQS